MPGIGRASLGALADSTRAHRNLVPGRAAAGALRHRDLCAGTQHAGAHVCFHQLPQVRWAGILSLLALLVQKYRY